MHPCFDLSYFVQTITDTQQNNSSQSTKHLLSAFLKKKKKNESLSVSDRHRGNWNYWGKLSKSLNTKVSCQWNHEPICWGSLNFGRPDNEICVTSETNVIQLCFLWFCPGLRWSALWPRKIISLHTAPTAHCTDSSENLAYITCENEWCFYVCIVKI